MLSTLVLMPPATGADAPAALGPLVRTLAALVPATMEGLVRDVAVLADRTDEGIRRVADHAGCALIEASRFDEALGRGLAEARSTRLFVIRAGAGFDRGLIDEIATLLGPAGNGEPVPLLLRQEPYGMMSRLAPSRTAVAGVIAPRSALESAARQAAAKDLAGLVRRLGRTRTLRSRASLA